MKEKLEKQLSEAQTNLQVILSRISNYDSQIAKLTETRNKEVQDAIRCDERIKLLQELLKENFNEVS